MITISNSGAERVKEFLENRGSGFGLRVLINNWLFWICLPIRVCGYN
jgi:hypothetical protein